MKKQTSPRHFLARIPLLLFLLFGISQLAFAQEKYTINGYVKDAKDGETLIGATIFAKEANTGATTNVYGFYSLSLPEGEYTLLYRYVGYKEVEKKITLNANQKIDVELGLDSGELEEVVISGDRDEDENVKSIEMSVNKVDITTIKKMPALLGEVDVIRSIQLLPGVSTVGEGATGFNVRGGGVGQNLVLLDEAPVFNSSHLFGFFSVFNPDAVKDVKLIKGGIPAQYGGRLSSILDVRMKEGNTKDFSAEGGIGAIFSRLTLSNPINKGKGSFVIAGRRSYADILAKPFLNDDLKGSKFFFYDLSAKVNYRFDDKNQVFLSGYFGRDVFDASSIGFLSNWGNVTGTLRWNHLFNDRLFSNTTVYLSDYNYELGFGEDNKDRFDWTSSITTYSLKEDLTYYLNPKNIITFGGQATVYDFDPGEATGISLNQTFDVSVPSKKALEFAVYAGNEETLSPKLSLQYGLRWSFFNYVGDGKAYEFGEPENVGETRPLVDTVSYGNWESIQTYNNFEPRLSIKYEVSPSASIKASYNRMAQYIHLISNTTASTPLDVWTPSTNNIEPQLADQIALGVFKNFKDNLFETSVEVYYKDIQNHIDYVDGADLLLNELLEGDLLSGEGRAYGAEFFVKKTRGKFNGWLSYTLARTERRVNGINNNEWYAAHLIKLTISTQCFSTTSTNDGVSPPILLWFLELPPISQPLATKWLEWLFPTILKTKGIMYEFLLITDWISHSNCKERRKRAKRRKITGFSLSIMCTTAEIRSQFTSSNYLTLERLWELPQLRKPLAWQFLEA